MNYFNDIAFEYEGLNFKKTFVFREKKLKKILIKDKLDKPEIDDVYVGKVVNYVREIDAYFVEFDHHIGFLKTKKEYRMGKFIPIVIVKEERKDKGYRISDEIYFKGENVIYFPDDVKNRFSRKLTEEKTNELSEHFKAYKGYLFRTGCDSASIEDIENEITCFEKLLDSLEVNVNVKNNKQRIYRNTHEEYIVEKIDDLSEILELEELLMAHRDKETIFPNGMKASFEVTKVGTVIDFDSYLYKSLKKNDYLQMNRELFNLVLDEMYIRNISGVVLIDSISINNRKEQQLFNQHIENAIKDFSDLKFHGITRLGFIELTRRIENKSIMEFSDEEILIDKLYLRINYLKEHASINSLEINLNPKYFTAEEKIIEIKKLFAFPMKFVYNHSVDDYSIKLLKSIDE